METDGLRYRHVLVACARWECDSIVEWIEYHRSIGFDHFYIYSNDDDWSDLYKILRPYILGTNPIVTYLYWSNVGEQIPIYIDYIFNYKDRSEWACFLDVDEFIVLKKWNNIESFVESFNERADCVYFNWINYGNSGLVSRDGRDVLISLTRRSRGIDVHTKTMFRTRCIEPAIIERLSDKADLPLTHFWNSYPFENFRMCNVIGDDVKNYTDRFPEAAQFYIQQTGLSEQIAATAYIAHFMFKSEDDFLRRAERGGFEAQSVWKQRFERGEHHAILEGLNEVEDFYLRDYWNEYTKDAVQYRR